MCKVPRQDYERIGKIISETGKENKDWYIINGKKINGWNLLFIRNIEKITRNI